MYIYLPCDSVLAKSISYSSFVYTLDFGLDPLKRVTGKSDADTERVRNSELMNGRLAMFAIGGIATQSVLTGHDFPYI